MTNEELKQLAESNARSIQAMIEQRATDKLEHEERIAQLKILSREHQERMRFLKENQRLILQTQTDIANLAGSLDEDRPKVLRKLNTIENKIDRIIESR